MYQSPILYKRNKRGKVQQWRVWTEGSTFVVEWGTEGGKLQTKVRKCEAKNVGRSNETTPEEQAALEAKSKFEHQITREDYHEDVDQAGRQVRAMLANDYTKVPHRVDWSQAVVQPKLNGLRLTAGKRYPDDPAGTVLMLTRKGEEFNVPHLIQMCGFILQHINNAYIEPGKQPCLALDGEVYLHGLPLQTISSWAKKYQPGKTNRLEYHLFDLVIPGLSYEERAEILSSTYEDLYEDPEICADFMERFKLVPSHECANEEQLKELHGKYADYEGVMIRHKDSLYECGERSNGLFKYKEFMDDEFLITGMWEDQNGNAMFACQTKDGKHFDCTPKRTHKERKQMLLEQDKYIGKWLNVKFQEYTPDGIPEFPVGLALRECDDEGNPLV